MLDGDPTAHQLCIFYSSREGLGIVRYFLRTIWEFGAIPRPELDIELDTFVVLEYEQN